MPPDISRWQASSNYDYVDDLGAAELAWEWLRRNGDYQRDYAAIEQRPDEAGQLKEMARQRWRLHYPRQPKPESHRDIRFLVAASRSRHRRPHSHASDPRI
jgi:hypothetical protein